MGFSLFVEYLGLVVEFFYFFEKVRGKNKVFQILVGRTQHFIFCSFPFIVSFMDVKNMLTNAQDRVHVMGVNNGGNIKLFGDVENKFVYN